MSVHQRNTLNVICEIGCHSFILSASLRARHNFHRVFGQILGTRLGDEVHIFDSHTVIEYVCVASGLYGNNVADFEPSAAVAVEVWHFMGAQTDGVTSMMN